MYTKYLLTLPQVAINDFHSLENRAKSSWFCTVDPQGVKVGSGGGTANLLLEAFQNEKLDDFSAWLCSDKKIVIHAGGESRRLPAYAHTGKILAPIPILRWGRGSALNQNLLDVQSPLLEEIIAQTNSKQNTLVASGDVLVRNRGKLPAIPDADVVCYGIWGTPEKASNHGVFFTPTNGSGEFSFMLQKPDNSQIAANTLSHHYLLDVGIWVLSNRAIEVLMKKCGWDAQTANFEGGIPKNYDLYSDFGLSLGANPTVFDEEISTLSVALVTLENGEFYHFGRNSELIESNVRLQNLVVNQKEIWHKKVKPHPSIFIQNSISQLTLSDANKNLWIENSYIPSTWLLAENHIVTGVPQNRWSLSIPSGVCLDFIPVGDQKYAIRPYGFNDDFKGAVGDAKTAWLDSAAREWFDKRNVSIDDLADVDIQKAAIFPILDIESIDEGFLTWLISRNPEVSEEYKRKYLNAGRLSATQICFEANLSRLYAQRNHFLVQAIPAIYRNYRNSIFYQLDLSNLAQTIASNNIELPLNGELNGMQQVSDYMLRARIEQFKNSSGEAFSDKAFYALQQCVLQTHGYNVEKPLLSVKDDQIVWGRSPLRLDIGGGWSDTPPYCFINGGAVVNMAVELNGQPPIQVFVKPSVEKKIIISSIDLGEKEIVSTYEELERYDQVGSPFSIPKAALCLVGFHPKFSKLNFQSLEEQLNDFGAGIEISILAAVPKGSGLGTSSILAATILGTLSNFCGLDWDKIKICSKTLVLEQLLTTGGGWQDQLGGVLHGVKLIETEPGFEQLPVVKWLPTDLFEMPETKGTFLLYYTGITRTAKNILSEIVQGMFLNSAKHLRTLDKIKNHASVVFDAVMRGNHEALSQTVATSWELNKSLDSGTSTPEIERIVEPIRNDLKAFKLLGAGGGGFMLMVAKDLAAAGRIKSALEANPINKKARFVDIEISKTGFKVTRS